MLFLFGFAKVYVLLPAQLVVPSEPQALAVGLKLPAQLVVPSEPQALAVGLKRIVVPAHG
ncbi:hypothetical protein Pla52n_31800 [Stieleria varia]|uniref:Uncharacterized protein n=1 Tax=Stieleria varia TaxID=2528005 RepID=A0A5C6ARL0_9BACT|nr:hypothetical protein Pla52n_31800 [Stieleria varia]